MSKLKLSNQSPYLRESHSLERYHHAALGLLGFSLAMGLLMQCPGYIPVTISIAPEDPLKDTYCLLCASKSVSKVLAEPVVATAPNRK